MLQQSPLEAPPDATERPAERRWALTAFAALALVALMAAAALRSLVRAEPARPAAPVDHGPLPPQVREAILALLEPHLDHPRLSERQTGGLREFHIQGRPKAPLAKEFHAAFRPLVVRELMPRLRPYGEVISFGIESLDYPPARLRPLS